MVTFGSGLGSASTARDAARRAATDALEAFAPPHAGKPKLAIVFASASYPDVEDVGRSLLEVVGDVPLVGGTSAAHVFGHGEIAEQGVSVVLLGGDGLSVAARAIPIASPMLVELVPVGRDIVEAADDASRAGFHHDACLVFAPSTAVDGEALVAAVRKGVGERVHLAGCVTGDDLKRSPPKVFVGDRLSSTHVSMTGIFTRHPIGIAARHGWKADGAVRTVTRADGVQLRAIDGRPALEVWLEDARSWGLDPPLELEALAVYLLNHHLIGIADEPRGAQIIQDDPLVVRAPLSIGADGSVCLTGAIPEGTHVRFVRATRDRLLRASADAATAAILRAGPPVVGALVLACSSRITALGEAFPAEPAEILRRVRAPIGGGCVYGEIARNVRDVDAFFNTTTVVVAFGGARG